MGNSIPQFVFTTKLMLKTIQNLNEEIKNKIFGINYGGCGIFTYYTAKTLLKTNTDFKIWYSWCGQYDSIDIKGNYNIFISKDYTKINLSKIVPYHIYIYLPKENFYFDGEEVSETPDGLMYSEYNAEYPKDLDFLKFTVDNASWNKDFNRKQVPELIKIINESFGIITTKPKWSIKQLFTAS